MADVAAINKPIPVVNNILPDTSLNKIYFKDTNPPAITVEKVLKYFTDRHSEKLVDRHIRLVKKFTDQYNDGYLIRDIKSVEMLINICKEKIERELSYEKPLCNFLKLCSKPFVKERSSDETQYGELMVEFIRNLGELMFMDNTAIQVEVAKSLACLYCAKGSQKLSTAYETTSSAFNRKLIEKSGVVQVIVQCLGKSDDIDVRMELMDTLQRFSESAINCDDMLSAGAARIVCNTLGEDNYTRNMFLAVDILWNLLENGSGEKISEQLDCLESISALNAAFTYLSSRGYSQADKQLRNDILVILLLISQYRPTAPFVETGFTKFLLFLATFTEVPSHQKMAKDFKLEKCVEDFEFKKLLMSAIVLMSKDPTAVQMMSVGHVLLSLFSFVKPNDGSLSSIWSSSRFEELQLHALSVLCAIAPLCIGDYMTCQGNNRLLLLLEWCVGQGDYGGHGNSYHAIGGRGNKRAQMRHCLRLLRCMCSTGDEAILQDLADQGTISQITSILWNAGTSCDENDAIDVEMQCDMLFIVSCLCEGDLHRKELFSVGGVDMVIEYLKKDPKNIHSPLGYHTLFLAAIDCVWSAILGCYITEQQFLEQEGVFLLLDLLEASPPTIQGVILGCLVDLCENPKALPHVYSWRGKSNITVSKLLIALWRKDEISLGVERSFHWVIKDLHKPLIGKVQAESITTEITHADSPSPSVVEISENIRAKIYTIFSKIGFNDVAGLSTMDYVTLAIIENYLEFKMFEIWDEISRELDVENVRPVSPDRECLTEIKRLFEERCANIIVTQKELIQNQSQQDLIEEQACYAKIIENHKQEEKAFKDFYDYVNRTSDYSVLKASKEKQLSEIDASRLYNEPEEEDDNEVHTTLQSNITTTTFCGRYVDLASDISTRMRVSSNSTKSLDLTN